MHVTAALIVDIILVAVFLLAAISGYRSGAVSSILSTIGVVAGLLVAAGLLPVVLRWTDSVALRFVLALGLFILLVALGNVVGGVLGSTLRQGVRGRFLRVLDSSFGAVFQTAVAMLVAWFIATPLATGIGGNVAAGIHSSTVLGGINRAVPETWKDAPASVSALLSDTGLPPLVSPYDASKSPQVEAPNIKVADRLLVEELRPSVIHVVSEAPSCRRRLMGSGFVTADDYVITNAHVVAGASAVTLDTTIGMRQADVVYYNPHVDIAVLYAPDLGLPALKWAEERAVTGQDAVVMGFPASGPFEAAPARVRDVLTIAGPDIYANDRVEREAYTVRGSIREGNSGGPMVDANGDVLGVVFGAAVDATDTGYVLTAREVLSQIGDVNMLTQPVGTAECVAQ
ncbi:serine protease (mycosin) [Corynebacterium renale]|uniref:Colicin V production protein n=1 Tax=Corynebacterium renale TaxID=1724 RepID=A0A2A9DNB5_9CORY|nr:colicin V production protein [Corynebacterium renale]SQI23344.1 serine protease (mycosin) [Corynebacterium renale]